MLVAEYDRFVRESDQSVGRPHEAQLDIALFGLAAEIGSLISALKKRLLCEAGREVWDHPNEEIIEELGDVMWYCFSLARIANPDKPINIFAHDISNLKREISASDARGRRIRGVLDDTKWQKFLAQAEHLPKLTRNMNFEDYQQLAFLTARTQKRTLTEVCIAVIWQLAAELFRRKLPEIELELNQSLPSRPINDVLGEIAWHISALAKTYNLSLSDIASKNIEKVSYRQNRAHPTPLHDNGFPSSEQFPRHFEVVFMTTARGRSRMYFDGKQLGDDLTDNAYDDDGYRFHDIMHLANVAKLGWSPVFRGLMGRKRKSEPKVDEIEDGARAKIVEEAVVKFIHSEGERIVRLTHPSPLRTPVRLFATRAEITFRFLKTIHELVSGLEVEQNRFWEWEDAIIEGYKIFDQLRRKGQGTVTIDLETKSISFQPEVNQGACAA